MNRVKIWITEASSAASNGSKSVRDELMGRDEEHAPEHSNKGQANAEQMQDATRPQEAQPQLAGPSNGMRGQANQGFWQLVGLGPLELKAAFTKLGYKEPNEIQQTLMDCVTKGKDIFFKAGTGKGKTTVMAVLVHLIAIAEPDSALSKLRIILVHPHTGALQKFYSGFDPEFRNKYITKCFGRNVAASLANISTALLLATTPDSLVLNYARIVPRFNAIEGGNMTLVVCDEADAMANDAGYRHHMKGAAGKIQELFHGQGQLLLMSATGGIHSTIPAVMETFPDADIELVISGPQGLDSRPDLITNFVPFTVDHSCRDIAQARAQLIVERIELGGDEKTMVFLKVMHDNKLDQNNSDRKGGNRKLHGNVIKLQNALQVKGIPYFTYHGEMGEEEKIKVMEQYMKQDGKTCLLTTTALSRSDILYVRRIVFEALPDSPENYEQMKGRGGRPGEGGCDIDIIYRQEDSETHFGRHLRHAEAVKSMSASLMAGMTLMRNAMIGNECIQRVIDEYETGISKVVPGCNCRICFRTIDKLVTCSLLNEPIVKIIQAIDELTTYNIKICNAITLAHYLVGADTSKMKEIINEIGSKNAAQFGCGVANYYQAAWRSIIECVTDTGYIAFEPGNNYAVFVTQMGRDFVEANGATAALAMSSQVQRLHQLTSGPGKRAQIAFDVPNQRHSKKTYTTQVAAAAAKAQVIRLKANALGADLAPLVKNLDRNIVIVDVNEQILMKASPLEVFPETYDGDMRISDVSKARLIETILAARDLQHLGIDSTWTVHHYTCKGCKHCSEDDCTEWDILGRKHECSYHPHAPLQKVKCGARLVLFRDATAKLHVVVPLETHQHPPLPPNRLPVELRELISRWFAANPTLVAAQLTALDLGPNIGTGAPMPLDMIHPAAGISVKIQDIAREAHSSRSGFDAAIDWLQGRESADDSPISFLRAYNRGFNGDENVKGLILASDIELQYIQDGSGDLYIDGNHGVIRKQDGKDWYLIPIVTKYQGGAKDCAFAIVNGRSDEHNHLMFEMLYECVAKYYTTSEKQVLEMIKSYFFDFERAEFNGLRLGIEGILGETEGYKKFIQVLRFCGSVHGKRLIKQRSKKCGNPKYYRKIAYQMLETRDREVCMAALNLLNFDGTITMEELEQKGLDMAASYMRSNNVTFINVNWNRNTRWVNLMKVHNKFIFEAICTAFQSADQRMGDQSNNLAESRMRSSTLKTIKALPDNHTFKDLSYVCQFLYNDAKKASRMAEHAENGTWVNGGRSALGLERRKNKANNTRYATSSLHDSDSSDDANRKRTAPKKNGHCCNCKNPCNSGHCACRKRSVLCSSTCAHGDDCKNPALTSSVTNQGDGAMQSEEEEEQDGKAMTSKPCCKCSDKTKCGTGHCVCRKQGKKCAIACAHGLSCKNVPEDIEVSEGLGREESMELLNLDNENENANLLDSENDDAGLEALLQYENQQEQLNAACKLATALANSKCADDTMMQWACINSIKSDAQTNRIRQSIRDYALKIGRLENLAIDSAGDCLPHAVLDQIQELKHSNQYPMWHGADCIENGWTKEMMRAWVMKAARDTNIQKLLCTDVDEQLLFENACFFGARSWEAWIAKMSIRNEYGDHIFMLLVSLIFHINVEIATGKEDGSVLVQLIDIQDGNAPTIHLGCHSNIHYMSLIPQPNAMRGPNDWLVLRESIARHAATLGLVENAAIVETATCNAHKAVADQLRRVKEEWAELNESDILGKILAHARTLASNNTLNDAMIGAQNHEAQTVDEWIKLVSDGLLADEVLLFVIAGCFGVEVQYIEGHVDGPATVNRIQADGGESNVIYLGYGAERLLISLIPMKGLEHDANTIIAGQRTASEPAETDRIEGAFEGKRSSARPNNVRPLKKNSTSLTTARVSVEKDAAVAGPVFPRPQGVMMPIIEAALLDLAEYDRTVGLAVGNDGATSRSSHILVSFKHRVTTEVVACWLPKGHETFISRTDVKWRRGVEDAGHSGKVPTVNAEVVQGGAQRALKRQRH